MREGDTAVSWGDLVCAYAAGCEVVHAAEGMFELGSLTRLDNGEGLGFEGSCRRPLDL